MFVSESEPRAKPIEYLSIVLYEYCGMIVSSCTYGLLNNIDFYLHLQNTILKSKPEPTKLAYHLHLHQI